MFQPTQGECLLVVLAGFTHLAGFFSDFSHPDMRFSSGFKRQTGFEIVLRFAPQRLRAAQLCQSE